MNSSFLTWSGTDSADFNRTMSGRQERQEGCSKGKERELAVRSFVQNILSPNQNRSVHHSLRTSLHFSFSTVRFLWPSQRMPIDGWLPFCYAGGILIPKYTFFVLLFLCPSFFLLEQLGRFFFSFLVVRSDRKRKREGPGRRIVNKISPRKPAGIRGHFLLRHVLKNKSLSLSAPLPQRLCTFACGCVGALLPFPFNLVPSNSPSLS